MTPSVERTVTVGSKIGLSQAVDKARKVLPSIKLALGDHPAIPVLSRELGDGSKWVSSKVGVQALKLVSYTQGLVSHEVRNIFEKLAEEGENKGSEPDMKVGRYWLAEQTENISVPWLQLAVVITDMGGKMRVRSGRLPRELDREAEVADLVQAIKQGKYRITADLGIDLDALGIRKPAEKALSGRVKRLNRTEEVRRLAQTSVDLVVIRQRLRHSGVTQLEGLFKKGLGGIGHDYNQLVREEVAKLREGYQSGITAGGETNKGVHWAVKAAVGTAAAVSATALVMASVPTETVLAKEKLADHKEMERVENNSRTATVEASMPEINFESSGVIEEFDGLAKNNVEEVTNLVEQTKGLNAEQTMQLLQASSLGVVIVGMMGDKNSRLGRVMKRVGLVGAFVLLATQVSCKGQTPVSPEEAKSIVVTAQARETEIAATEAATVETPEPLPVAIWSTDVANESGLRNDFQYKTGLPVGDIVSISFPDDSENEPIIIGSSRGIEVDGEALFNRQLKVLVNGEWVDLDRSNEAQMIIDKEGYVDHYLLFFSAQGKDIIIVSLNKDQDNILDFYVLDKEGKPYQLKVKEGSVETASLLLDGLDFFKDSSEEAALNQLLLSVPNNIKLEIDSGNLRLGVSEDGKPALFSGEELKYTFDSDVDTWVEAKPPLGETQPWMEEYVEAYSQMEGVTLETFVVEDYEYEYYNYKSNYDALKITRNVPTEKMVENFATLYDPNEIGLMKPLSSKVGVQVAGIFGGEVVLLKQQGFEGGGRAETWVSLMTVNNGPNGDGQVVKLWFNFESGFDYSDWGNECPNLGSDTGDFLSVNSLESVLGGSDPIIVNLGHTTINQKSLSQAGLNQNLYNMGGGFFHLRVDLD